MTSATYYYVDQYTDEVMPCAPTLEAWAEWLSKPDEDWNHDPAIHGETFAISTLVVLGDIKVDFVDGAWMALTPVPEGTDEFFLRYEEDGDGWDAEHSANTIEDAMDCMDSDDGPVWMACVKSGGEFTGRFELTDDGKPTLVLSEAA